jgi:hypothetical protein
MDLLIEILLVKNITQNYDFKAIVFLRYNNKVLFYFRLFQFVNQY